MSKRLALTGLLLLALVLAPAGCASPQAVTAPPEKPTFDPVAIYEKATPATWTVLVNTVDGWWAKGSGFSVGKPSQVLTAYHVVKDYKEFRLVDWDGDTTYTATVKRFDAKADLALLEIANPSNTAFLTLADEKVKPGQEVLFISSPKVQSEKPGGYIPAFLWQGVVGQARDGRVFAATQSVPGSSGGVLIGASGGVVGLLLGAIEADSPISVFLDRDALASFLSGP